MPVFLLFYIAYGIRVLPLVRELRVSHTHVTQLWYTDDAGAGGKFGHILEHLWDLQAQGPARGYYPEPTKSILVMALDNVARVEEFFWGGGAS